MYVDLDKFEGRLERLVEELKDARTGELKRKFRLGDHVQKVKGARWKGHVVGFYETQLTPIGYCVESDSERGSVQIYPEAALDLVPRGR